MVDSDRMTERTFSPPSSHSTQRQAIRSWFGEHHLSGIISNKTSFLWESRPENASLGQTNPHAAGVAQADYLCQVSSQCTIVRVYGCASLIEGRYVQAGRMNPHFHSIRAMPQCCQMIAFNRCLHADNVTRHRTTAWSCQLNPGIPLAEEISQRSKLCLCMPDRCRNTGVLWFRPAACLRTQASSRDYWPDLTS